METANKKFRYSIRKFKVGVGSVLIATCLLGAGVSTPTAFARKKYQRIPKLSLLPFHNFRIF